MRRLRRPRPSGRKQSLTRMLREKIARDAAEEQALIAESRRLAAESSSALTKYPQRSLLLAVQATKLGRSVSRSAGGGGRTVVKRSAWFRIRVVLATHDSQVRTVAISPDNHWLVTGDTNEMAWLWDLRAKDPAANPVALRAHEDTVYAAAISPDNRWLVTGSADKTARLWDLTAKDPAASQIVLRGHGDTVNTVAISPDSNWVVTGSADKTARL